MCFHMFNGKHKTGFTRVVLKVLLDTISYPSVAVYVIFCQGCAAIRTRLQENKLQNKDRILEKYNKMIALLVIVLLSISGASSQIGGMS